MRYCSVSMKILTIKEAIALVPAIGAKEPTSRVSSKYQFVSTQEILEQVQERGWLIANASAHGQNLHAQHRVTLVHKDSLEAADKEEGMLRIEMFNSHNRTKRLTFAIGYFRFVCSNGLIIASGPAETIRTKHSITGRTNQLPEESLYERINQLADKFPLIAQKINNLQKRQLTEQEQINFATFAIKGRYLHRPRLPKRFDNLEETASKFLNVRREADAGNSTWSVYNRVQENVIAGIPDFTQPLKSFTDNIRVNYLLWKGAEASIDSSNEEFKNTLQKFLTKRN